MNILTNWADYTVSFPYNISKLQRNYGFQSYSQIQNSALLTQWLLWNFDFCWASCALYVFIRPKLYSLEWIKHSWKVKANDTSLFFQTAFVHWSLYSGVQRTAMNKYVPKSIEKLHTIHFYSLCSTIYTFLFFHAPTFSTDAHECA